MNKTMEVIEAPNPVYVKFEEDNMKVKICRGRGELLEYVWVQRVYDLGFIPVILFRKAFAELGKTGVCGEDAMFEVPWQAAESLRLTVEILAKSTKEASLQMLEETNLCQLIFEKNWEKLLDVVSVYALAKKLEVRGIS